MAPNRPIPKRPEPIIGTHVSAVWVKGGYSVVTVGLAGASPVGPRLDRGRGSYPECKAVGLCQAEADSAVKMWDAFLELNKLTKGKK